MITRTDITMTRASLWTNPHRIWLESLTNQLYLQWIDLAEEELGYTEGALEEAGDIVHEALVELLESIQDGYTFESKEKMQMYIQRSIDLICNVAQSGKHWQAH